MGSPFDFPPLPNSGQQTKTTDFGAALQPKLATAVQPTLASAVTPQINTSPSPQWQAQFQPNGNLSAAVSQRSPWAALQPGQIQAQSPAYAATPDKPLSQPQQPQAQPPSYSGLQVKPRENQPYAWGSAYSA